MISVLVYQELGRQNIGRTTHWSGLCKGGILKKYIIFHKIYAKIYQTPIFKNAPDENTNAI